MLLDFCFCITQKKHNTRICRLSTACSQLDKRFGAMSVSARGRTSLLVQLTTGR